MPMGDGTGPMGQGRMTGRGMGYCAGYVPTGGRGPGMGRGFRCRRFVQVQPVQMSREEQIKVLRGQKDSLHQELGALDKKLAELEKDAKE